MGSDGIKRRQYVFFVPFLAIFRLLTSPKTYPFHWNLVSVLQEDNRTTSVMLASRYCQFRSLHWIGMHVSDSSFLAIHNF